MTNLSQTLAEALRNIAEGNLGDDPWQANYAKIKETARAAVAAYDAAALTEPQVPGDNITALSGFMIGRACRDRSGDTASDEEMKDLLMRGGVAIRTLQGTIVLLTQFREEEKAKVLRQREMITAQKGALSGLKKELKSLQRTMTKRLAQGETTVVQRLEARICGHRAEIARLKALVARVQSERPYIVGWNDGWAEKEYQDQHGVSSDGDVLRTPVLEGMLSAARTNALEEAVGVITYVMFPNDNRANIIAAIRAVPSKVTA